MSIPFMPSMWAKLEILFRYLLLWFRALRRGLAQFDRLAESQDAKRSKPTSKGSKFTDEVLDLSLGEFKMGCSSREKPIRSKRRLKHVANMAPSSKIEDITEKMLDSPCKPPKFFGNVVGEEKLNDKDKSCHEHEDGDWGLCTEEQLEDLLLRNLQHFYNEALIKIKDMGYSEEEALKAVLRNGHGWYGSSDVLTNIMNSAMDCLRSGNNSANFEESDIIFRDLKQLEEYSLAGMVCYLRQVRPQLSKGDAMWCLLMSDLHIGKANTLQVPKLPHGDERAMAKCTGNNCIPHSAAATSMPFPMRSFGCRCSDSKRLPAVNNLNQSNVRSMDASSAHNGCGLDHGAINVTSSSKALATNAAMKVSNFNSNAMGFLSKGPPAERKSKSESSSHSVDCPHVYLARSSYLQATQSESGLSCSKNRVLRQCHDIHVENETDGNGVNIAATDLSLGISSSPELGQSNCRADSRYCNDIVGALLGSLENMGITDKSEGADHKNETMLKLMHQVRDLEIQLKERREWAQEKAMQAAKKLSNDLAELKMLRMEKDEMLRLKQDKQALEESTVKKIHEMESAWKKAHAQLDRATAAIKRLEDENAELKAELQACKLSASESLATCQKIAKREKKYQKRAQDLEKQKSKIQEDIRADRQRVAQLQEELLHVEELQKETEAKIKQEEKIKEKALAQAEEVRRARDAIEAAARRREEALQGKTEMDFQRYKDDIERLEQERARLKASAESSKQHSSNNNPHSSDWCGGVQRSQQAHAKSSSQGLKESQESSRKDSCNDRQCRICSKEEVSVLFLPCAHQIVCVKCNEFHEKKGSKHCPSCKTPIQQRIRVYGQSS